MNKQPTMSQYAQMVQSGITFMFDPKGDKDISTLQDDELIKLHYALLILGASGDIVHEVWEELLLRRLMYSTQVTITAYKDNKLLPGGPICLNQ